jgi:hypothetical protein
LVKTVCQAVRRDERARHDNYCKNIVSPWALRVTT